MSEIQSLERPKVTVVIPVYENAGALWELHERLIKVRTELNAMNVGFQIIFVDDGSRDGSQEILRSLSRADRSISIIRLTRNFGATRSLKTGLQFVTGSAFAWMSADLQDPPELLVEMTKRWLSGSKFVICERASRGDPWITRFSSSIFYRVLRGFVIPDYPRGGFDMALMDRELLEPIRASSKSTYAPILAYWLGHEPSVIRYSRENRRHGKSHWTLRKRFNLFTDVLFGFSVKPLRFVTYSGIGLSGVATLYAGVVALGALRGSVESVGFPTLVTLITLFAGLQLVTIGVLGEYVSRIMEQMNQRPEAVILETVLPEDSPEMFHGT